MKTWTDIRAWMEWRGIKAKDLLLVGVTMGFLLSVTIVFVWGLIESLG